MLADASVPELVSKGTTPGIENHVTMTTLRMDCDVAIGRAKRHFHAFWDCWNTIFFLFGGHIERRI
jgi:hypothetical protein